MIFESRILILDYSSGIFVLFAEIARKYLINVLRTSNKFLKDCNPLEYLSRAFFSKLEYRWRIDYLNLGLLWKEDFLRATRKTKFPLKYTFNKYFCCIVFRCCKCVCEVRRMCTAWMNVLVLWDFIHVRAFLWFSFKSFEWQCETIIFCLESGNDSPSKTLMNERFLFRIVRARGRKQQGPADQILVDF